MSDCILTLKNKYSDPYIILAWDFNRRSLKEATKDCPAIKPVKTPPTRGTATLDIISSNMGNQLLEAGITAPISTREGVESDHRTVYASFRMPRVPSYKITKYTYVRKNEEGLAKFDHCLASQDWSLVMELDSASEKVQALHNIIEQGMLTSFEKKTSVRKTSEPSWISKQIRDTIRRRRAVFKREGRSENWRRIKKMKKIKV